MTRKQLKDKLFTAINKRNSGEGETSEVNELYYLYAKEFLEKKKKTIKKKKGVK
jgi:hypothetical protein